MYKLIEGEDSKNIEEEVVGDPWTILPVKTRKYAKECIEIVLSKRHITKLINFNDFENLEALWLTNNNPHPPRPRARQALSCRKSLYR